MKKVKKSYIRCAEKGCQKKAVIKGKCSKCNEHSKKKSVEESSTKKVDSHALSEKAKKINKVKKSQEGLREKTKNTTLSRKKSFLKTLFFKAGSAAGKSKRFIKVHASKLSSRH